MSIQLFAASFVFPAGLLHAYPIKTNYSTTTISNNRKTTAAITAEQITSQDQIWKWSAIGLAIYLALTMICFFCMIWLREKQQKGPLKEKTVKTQRSSRSERLLKHKQEDGSPDETLPSKEVVKQMQTTMGSKRRPTKFFIDEDVTQELTVSLRQTPEMDYVETAHGGSETSLYQVPSYPIRPQSPPSTFSGTETVPQTETLSGTQQGSDSRSRRSETESKTVRSGSTTSSRSGTTTSSRTSSTSSTLTPSRTTSSSTSSWSSSSSSSSRSSGSSSRTMRR